LDNPLLKVFMRGSVLISEYFIYVPAVVVFCRQYARLRQVTIWENSIALTAILMQPALILIDHGHFQYNAVMLGFVAAFMACLMHRQYALSCVFFVAALGFKQMALYYAPAVFAYLLGSCVFPVVQPMRLIIIGLVTAVSFVVLVLPLAIAPLLESSKNTSSSDFPIPPLLANLNIDRDTIYYPISVQLTQMIHRVFPFHRGLFEDKVANFWCSLHTFHKLHHYPKELLQQLSLLLTGLSILPPCLAIFLSPQRANLPLALAASAWGFFLFSFQVHEKSVLVPLMPMTLLLSGGLQSQTRSWIALANILACWTMYPLLKRDQLSIPYFVLTGLWAWLLGVPAMIFFPAPGTSGSTEPIDESLRRLLHGSFYACMLFWHIVEALLPPPQGKPDLWVVVNVLIGAPGFAICYLWCLWRLWTGFGRQGSAQGGISKSKML
jgi:alpha-1,3-glucosyltransferase